MIPLSSLGGGAARPPAAGAPGLVPLGSLGGGAPAPGGAPPPFMAPPSGAPPTMAPPPGGPPGSAPPADAPGGESTPAEKKSEEDPSTTLAEVGKEAKEYLDVLMPISIPHNPEDDRPVPKIARCLEDGSDLFKIFDVDMHKFDPKAARKTYHKLQAILHPDKLGREATPADQARFTKLRQAFTVIMDDQMRAVYRQHCYGIAGSGGIAAQGHDNALSKSLEMGRDLRKMGEDRAIVLHKAAETGWAVKTQDKDGRTMNQDGRKQAHQFNLFGDISSSDDEADLEKERRSMTIAQILEKSPKYADLFLEKVKPIMLDPKISNAAAGGAFTMLEKPEIEEFLNQGPKSLQKLLRKVRASVKQMNWAMTTLLQQKESPWRGLEVRASLVEHGTVKFLEIMRSAIAVGKFSAVHVDEFAKLLDNMHRLYMDIFERRGQELLRSAIAAELQVIYVLPESGGRLPDGTRIILQDLQARADLNGKKGTVTGWDYFIQRYNVDVDQEDANANQNLPANPDLMSDDLDDADDDEEEEVTTKLAVPKKLMVQPKNVQVDLTLPLKKLEGMSKDWNAWMNRPRSVSASQDAEAVAAALGPPLQSMAGYLQEAASALAAGVAGGRDGADLIAFECRESLQGARNLAAKLLGEEPQEPPPPPSMTEPPPALVPVKADDPMSRVLKEAAEVAAAGIDIKRRDKTPKKKKDRSRSRRRRRHRSSSS